MEKLFKGAREKIVVGLKINDSARSFIQNVAHLCQRTGMGMRIVNVVEEHAPLGYYYPEFFLGYDWALMTREQLDMEIVEHEKIVKDLKASMQTPTDIETRVVSAYRVADALLDDARAHQASLIVIGLDTQDYKMIPRGLSVALTALTTAPMPVLALRTAGKIDFNRASQRILIADDLSPACEKVVWAGISFAASLKNAEVFHVHVLNRGLSKDLDTGPRDPAGEIPPSQDALWPTIEKKLEETLRARAHRWTSLMEAAGCSYRTQVLKGDVLEHIVRLQTSLPADIVVFGHHHTVHYKPLGLGQVPLKALLSGLDAILIVPSQ